LLDIEQGLAVHVDGSGSRVQEAGGKTDAQRTGHGGVERALRLRAAGAEPVLSEPKGSARTEFFDCMRPIVIALA
jgi:hypothetical protein